MLMLLVAWKKEENNEFTNFATSLRHEMLALLKVWEKGNK